ncbi:LacI family DNA-binding transcriptional regulator [Mesorhizobium sp. B1-1-8]|uniref:LacI family DNA-binding transcriptional regulator n=1 Tax=Mesorhizobium sp. B1-1-8 TaxID=2589976 RepID=UPI001D033A70|nr:LacI family DNA-binding transcriptional regulator [Mesorhizobium sp. B1-1-8]UCI05176.1 LacI family transcriptional regulator [Mesorhizobium sp. B1-1-8]
MRDVAALAGVSIKTVSRVINGEKYISDAIAKKVNEAVHRLNYRHNLAASQLRAGANSFAVGVILVDISNPFSAAVHRAVEDVFREAGVAVLLASTDEEAEREWAAVHAFSRRRVDGLVIMPASHDQAYLKSEIEAGTHIVFIDRPPAFLNVDFVVSDNRRGARSGVDHLIRFGHRRIGFIGDRPMVSSSQLRFEGYEDALAAANIDMDASIVCKGFADASAAQRATEDLLSRDSTMTALFVAQNALCAPAIRALRSLGKGPNVAVVGFDGFDGADLIEPGLTVIAQNPALMGRTAACILLKRMKGGSPEPHARMLDTHLIARGSGEIRGPFLRDSLLVT